VVPLEEVVRTLSLGLTSCSEVRNAVVDLVVPGNLITADLVASPADLLACRSDDGHAVIVFRPVRYRVEEWERGSALAETMLGALHPGATGPIGRWVDTYPDFNTAAAATLTAADQIFQVAAREARASIRVRRAEVLARRRAEVAQGGEASLAAAALRPSGPGYPRFDDAVRHRAERLIRERLLRLSPRLLGM
jgi:hypothetical protein